MRRIIWTIMAMLLLLGAPAWAADGKKAEVIHWWVSGSEAAALQVVIDEFESRGYEWVDTPVEASYQAKTAALSRMLEGRPPTMVQWHVGLTVKDLYSQKLLHSVQELAEAEGWREALPPVIWDYSTVDGQVVVAPLTMHGSNWIWAGRQVLEKVGVNLPQTWDDFFDIAPKIKEAGYIPLALGGQPWQENLLFMNVALAVGGADFYQAAFVDHDPEALGGDTMAEAFRLFGRLRPFVDAKSPGRGWSQTAELISRGRAAFYVMGDWAKGEFQQAGLTADQGFEGALCPGTDGAYLVVSDAFAMVALTDPKDLEIQKVLAGILMDPEVQRKFNLVKGSIPPRKDAPREGFDRCARKAMEAVAEGARVLPGLNMANTEIVASAVLDVVSSFWNNPDADPAETAAALARAVKEAGF